MRDFASTLPEDIVLFIASYSRIEDVLALKQTCRHLYSVIDSDYLWHQLLPREELPLCIPPSYDLRKFGAVELQAASVRALKLRANWSKKDPRIQHLNVAISRTYVGSSDELKLLHGATILLDVHRDRHSQKPVTIVYAYNLLNADNAKLTSQLSIPAILKDFDASVENRGTELVLAGTFKKESEILEVYTSQFPTESLPILHTAYNTSYSYALRHDGLFHKVSLHGEFVASSIRNQSLEEGWPSSAVLVANWETRKQITIFPRFHESVDQIDLKILPPNLVIIAASFCNLQVILVPLSTVELGGILESPAASKGKQHILPDFPNISVPLVDFYDICISDNVNFGTHVPATSLSVITFPTLSRLETRQNKKALHLRFRIDPGSNTLEASRPSGYPSALGSSISGTSVNTSGKSNVKPPVIRLESSTPFDVPVGSYPEHPYLGTTGRRAVWLEQSLKSDYVQILRLDCDLTGGSPSVSVLLPPEPHLPFKPSSCRALAFDEATGRLCVGLYNGTIYILDYA